MKMIRNLLLDHLYLFFGLIVFTVILLFWIVPEVKLGTFALLGPLGSSANSFSSQTSWYPIIHKISQGNLFPSLPSVDYSQSGFSFYPYISLWIHALHLKIFGNTVAQFLFNLVYPLATFVFMYLIYARSISSAWAALLTLLSLVCFVPYPLRDYISTLLGTNGLHGGMVQGLEIIESPFPLFSILLFIIAFFYTTQIKRMNMKRMLALNIVWALQFYVHPYNAVVGLPFWFLYFVFIIRKQNSDSSIFEIVKKFVAPSIIIVCLLLIPAFIGYSKLGNSILFINQAALGAADSKEGILFGHFYSFAYFILPTILSVFLYSFFKLDLFELWYRFYPIFILIFIEFLIWTSNILFQKSFAPQLVFSRLGIFFLHFYYLVPVIYFLGQKVPDMKRMFENKAIRFLVKVSNLLFRKLEVYFLIIVSIVTILFAKDISRNKIENESLYANELIKVNQIMKDMSRFASEKDLVVFEEPWMNLLSVNTTNFQTLLVNRFSNQITYDECLSRLILFARIIGWNKTQFSEFMSPGKIQNELWIQDSGSEIPLLKDSVLKSGLGFWLLMHKTRFQDDEAKIEYIKEIENHFEHFDLSNALNKFKIKWIYTQNLSNQLKNFKYHTELYGGKLFVRE